MLPKAKRCSLFLQSQCHAGSSKSAIQAVRHLLGAAVSRTSHIEPYRANKDMTRLPLLGERPCLYIAFPLRFPRWVQTDDQCFCEHPSLPASQTFCKNGSINFPSSPRCAGSFSTIQKPPKTNQPTTQSPKQPKPTNQCPALCIFYIFYLWSFSKSLKPHFTRPQPLATEWSFKAVWVCFTRDFCIQKGRAFDLY